MKKLSLDDLKAMNDVNLEKGQMKQVFGGDIPPDCTLDTITVTPSGSSNDGNDDYAGECD